MTSIQPGMMQILRHPQVVAADQVVRDLEERCEIVDYSLGSEPDLCDVLNFERHMELFSEKNEPLINHVMCGGMGGLLLTALGCIEGSIHHVGWLGIAVGAVAGLSAMAVGVWGGLHLTSKIASNRAHRQLVTELRAERVDLTEKLSVAREQRDQVMSRLYAEAQQQPPAGGSVTLQPSSVMLGAVQVERNL